MTDWDIQEKAIVLIGDLGLSKKIDEGIAISMVGNLETMAP